MSGLNSIFTFISSEILSIKTIKDNYYYVLIIRKIRVKLILNKPKRIFENYWLRSTEKY